MSILLRAVAVLWAFCGAAHAGDAAAASAWSRPPSELAGLCAEALHRAETALQGVAAVPAGSHSFANTPEALETALQDLEDAAAPAVLLGRVAVSSAARAAGGLCEARLDAFAEDVLARGDLYRALGEYAALREPLTGEKRRLLERELAELSSRGAGLDRESRLELRFVRERLAARERSFLDNLDWPRSSLLFSPEELSGLPERALAALPRQGRLLRVEAEPEIYGEFQVSVRDPAARQRLEFLFHNRAAAANGPVLKEILSLRGRGARLLGASSYARLALRDRLAAAPSRARDILESFAKRLRPGARQDLAACLELKRRELGPRADREIRPWERDYYAARLRPAPRAAPAPPRRLPDEAAVAGALEVAGRLLGLSLPRAPSADVWSSSVSVREVRDAGSSLLLGRLYLDLHPRPGKAERPDVFVLRPGRDSAGGRVEPACVLSASFPSARGAVGDLEDFYHGLGHVFGVVLSRSRYARFSGAGLSADGAEVPALLLGRLAWRPEAAGMVFGPRQGPGLLAEAVRGREASWPWRALDDAAFALADLGMHDGGAADPGKAYQRARERWALEAVTPGTHPEASAAALVRDPAGASGPVLAALLSEEIWRRWVEEGLFNPASGQHLRDTLFAPSAAELRESLRNYLGREPSWDAAPGPEAWPAGLGEGPQGPPWRRRVLR